MLRFVQADWVRFEPFNSFSIVRNGCRIPWETKIFSQKTQRGFSPRAGADVFKAFPADSMPCGRHLPSVSCGVMEGPNDLLASKALAGIACIRLLSVNRPSESKSKAKTAIPISAQA